MTAKLPHEVKLLVASSNLCSRGIFHDKEATTFFSKVFPRKNLYCQMSYSPLGNVFIHHVE